ncbi:MAG: substrate-binding domain-containing protein, partial [Burkholderiales bacterium]
MKLNLATTLLSTLVGSLISMSAMAQDATGAGASFPAPIYAKWAEAYKAATGKAINYQSIGSSGGIKQIKAKTVDFGATDDPMKGEEVEAGGMVQFPAVMGGGVAVYNNESLGIPSGTIKLNGPVLA